MESIMENEKLIINQETLVDEETALKQLIHLFESNKDKVYENQKAIADAINEMFGNKVNRTQGTVSKALSLLKKRKYRFEGKQVIISKCSEGYVLLSDERYEEELIDKLYESVNEQEVKFLSFTKKIHCFQLPKSSIIHLKNYIEFTIDKEYIFDSFVHNGKVYILLNPELDLTDLEDITLRLKSIAPMVNTPEKRKYQDRKKIRVIVKEKKNE